MLNTFALRIKFPLNHHFLRGCKRYVRIISSDPINVPLQAGQKYDVAVIICGHMLLVALRKGIGFCFSPCYPAGGSKLAWFHPNR